MLKIVKKTIKNNELAECSATSGQRHTTIALRVPHNHFIGTQSRRRALSDVKNINLLSHLLMLVNLQDTEFDITRSVYH